MKAFDVFQARKLRFELASAQVLKSWVADHDIPETCCGEVPGSLAICQNCDRFKQFIELVDVEMAILDPLSLEELRELQKDSV